MLLVVSSSRLTVAACRPELIVSRVALILELVLIIEVAVQSGTAYLDSAYSLGFANGLMPGYDCPTYATYLNITFGGYYSSRDVNGS